MDQLSKAIIFATEKHQGQTRRDGVTPYIVHPLAVLTLLRQKFISCSKESQIAAVLHDTVEDCGVTNADILKEFGYTVAKIVADLTKEIRPKDIPKLEFHKTLYENFAKSASDDAVRVKICDRLDNISGLHLQGKKFQKYYMADTNLLLDSLAKFNRELYPLFGGFFWIKNDLP